jgi:hypothetical protein
MREGHNAITPLHTTAAEQQVRDRLQQPVDERKDEPKGAGASA